MTLASEGYVGYGVETTEGDLSAPTIFLPVNSFNVDSTNDNITPEQLRGSRDKYVTMPSPYSVSGSMDMELVPNGIRSLLKSAFAHSGAYTPGAYQTSAYASVLIPGSASTPTFSFEASAGDILIMRYGGVRVNTLEINATYGEIVSSSWGLEGTTRAKQGSPTADSYAAVLPFHFTGASVARDGVNLANVQNFSFTVGNNVDRRGTLRKTRDWRRTVLGNRDVGLSLTLDFDNDDEYDLFEAETEFSVELHMEGGFVTGSSGPKNTLKILIPRVRWNSISQPLNAGDYIEQAVEAQILRPFNNDPVFTATLVNSEGTAF